MRTLTRKLLSLLLVFTMVCAMVPAAMAAERKIWGRERRQQRRRPPRQRNQKLLLKLRNQLSTSMYGMMAR